MERKAKNEGSIEQRCKQGYYSIFEGKSYDDLPPVETKEFKSGTKDAVVLRAIRLSPSELLLEQNPKKFSIPAARARKGEKILWYIDNRVTNEGESHYKAIVENGKFRWLK